MGQDKLTGKLKILMVARVLVATSILVSYYFFQFFYKVEATPMKWLVVIIIITYVLTIIYSLLIGRTRNLRRFAYAQYIGDTLIISSVLYITGGVTSPFSVLYTVSILSAAIILYMRGALLVASFSSILYGLLITFQLYGLIEPPGYYDYADVEEITLYRLIINITGYYLIALLSGFLVEKLRRVDDELEVNKRFLEELQELHDNVIRSINVGLIITDKRGIPVTINDSALQLLGIRKSEIKDGDISVFLVYPEIKGILAGLGKEELALSKLEKHVAGNRGEERVLGMNFSFWRSHEGSVNGLVILLQDITAEKELERSVKLHEKLAAIGELAAGLAHEIRNPLASMNGSVQMLKEGDLPDPEQRKKLLSIIQREANRLNNIVTEFLSYAAPISPAFREVHLKPFLDDFVQLLKSDSGFGKQMEISVSVPDDIHYPIDEQRMTQLLWNIARNAIDSITEAKRERGILTWKAEKRNKSLVMTFRDNGTGVSEEADKKLFTPFYTTKEGGTGLGLALVHTIVKEHNGEIVLNRNLAEGVEFRITLNQSP